MKPSQKIQVLLPTAVDKPFSYSVPQGLSAELGDIVIVNFRSRLTIGVVWKIETEGGYQGTLKEIESIVEGHRLPKESLDFIGWVARYTLNPLGMVLKMVLSGSSEKMGSEKKTRQSKLLVNNSPDFTLQGPELSPDQAEAVSEILQSTETFQPFLLDGVTGSGKTEVYFDVIKEVLQQGKQVLVLLPEIALSSQWLERFHARFGEQPLQWHSGLSKSVKKQTWKMILDGKQAVVVGARSALFLPFANLGLIIVDEEHDISYKQDEQTYYHARDMAVVRAQISRIPIVLASATPSLETVVNVNQGRYKHLQLKSRYGGAHLPTLQIVDMRQYAKSGKNWISPPLRQALSERLESGQQSILFLNRRGYAPLTLCHHCGHRFICLGCTSWLVHHKNSNKLQCHYCGYNQSAPTCCPACQAEDGLIACGPGVERIYDEVVECFPSARVLMVASDTLTTMTQMQEMVSQITNHEVDIVVGTQVLAKGYHFPMMTLIGVIDADLGLSGGDLRACERTYQLLHQVSGRAGREQLPGKVLLQTYNPTHPVIVALSSQAQERFVECELAERQQQMMPPYGRLAAIIISGFKLDQVEKAAKALSRIAPRHPDLLVLGPVPAPLSLLRGRYRWRFLIKASKNFPLQSAIAHWVKQVSLVGNVKLVVDIDPYSFL
jgi:primosomal protein N' (replication factor Y)